MAKIAKKHQDKFDRIKNNVESAIESQSKNSQSYWNSKDFIFKSSMSDDEKDAAISLGRTTLESNELEPYISRQVGEMYRQLPDPHVLPRIEDDPSLLSQAEIIEDYIRYKFEEAINIRIKCFKDMISGGFYVFEVANENIRQNSFDQQIVIKRVHNVTKCGFDPMAKESHRGDGEFCFKMVPKLKKDFEEIYDVKLGSVNFSSGDTWFGCGNYHGQKQDVVSICCYWEKRYDNKKLLLVSNPIHPDAQISIWEEDYEKMISEAILEGKIESELPKIIKEEDRRIICGLDYYELIGSKILKHEEVEGKYLRLVRASGNPEDLKEGEMDKSMIYQAMDIQRAKNMSFQSITTQIENQGQTDEYVAEDSLPTGGDALLSWTQPQRKHIAKIWKHQDKNGSPIPPPHKIPATPIDATIMQFYLMMSESIQKSLGSFDSQQGIQRQDMSGIAIQNGAIQANNAIMPYVINFIEAWQQAAIIFIDLIPKYLTTLRSINGMNREGKSYQRTINNSLGDPRSKISYKEDDMNVKVKMDLNFEMQKQVALKNIETASQLSQNAQKFFGTVGFHFVLDNMTFRDVGKVKEEYRKFMDAEEKNAQQSQKAAMEMNPVIAQTKISEMKMQSEEADRKLDLIKVIAETKIAERKVELEEAKTEAQILESRDRLLSDSLSVNAENTRSQVEAAIAMDRHAYNKIESERAHALKVRDSNRGHALDLTKTLLENKHDDSKERKPDEEIGEGTQKGKILTE